MLLSDRADAAAVHRVVGLRTLIHDDADVVAIGRGGINVATRKIAASRRAVCCPAGGCGYYPEFFEEEEEVEGGFWALYGWRRRLRRLPPLIPSIRRAGSSPWTLTRTRTADGRVVVQRMPAPLRGHVLATKVDGRLVLDLVEHDGSPVRPPPRRPQQPLAHASAPADDEDKDEEAIADLGSARRDVPITAARAPPPMTTTTTSPVCSAGSPLPSVGCFEAVIRTSPLRKVPVNLPRMVH